MFEHTFKTQTALLTSDARLIGKLWSEIQASYSKRGRHYHTLSHLDHLLAELLPVQDTIHDWQTLSFSIAYHDFIYNPLKHDNENKSAELACKRLSMLSATPSRQERCFSQIMATKAHSLSEDNDTNLFTDADLSILGSDAGKYNQYAKEIRKEYKLYPDLIYNPGRQKVLQHFLQMPFIYKTTFFCNKYEEQARINLNRELEELSS